MKKLLVTLAVAAALLGIAAPSHAWPGGWRGGWYGGWYGPYGNPFWYAPAAPYVYTSPVVVQPAQPPVLIQQQPQQQYWYFCQEANGYYPSVQQCPSGWMQVLPQGAPPAGPR
jgi:hypothetical protein